MDELFWTDSTGDLLAMEPFVLEDQHASLAESDLRALLICPLYLEELVQFQRNEKDIIHHDLSIQEYLGEAPTPEWFAHMLEAESTQDQLVYQEALDEKKRHQ